MFKVLLGDFTKVIREFYSGKSFYKVIIILHETFSDNSTKF